MKKFTFNRLYKNKNVLAFLVAIVIFGLHYTASKTEEHPFFLMAVGVVLFML